MAASCASKRLPVPRLRSLTSAWTLLALLLLASSAEAAPEVVETFPDAFAALRDLLGKRRVIAFGELHEIAGKSDARSSLARFHTELLGPLLPFASDLIVETWVTTGSCGETEKKVVAEVENSTQRPATTENEIITVLKQAKAGGVAPHMLEIDCHDYAALTDAKTGEVDYEKLLSLVTRGLERQMNAALARSPKSDKAVLVYGGALHNDVFPRRELAAYSFARTMTKRTRGRYLEIDLYVPEYIEHDDRLTAEAWYGRYQRAAQPGRVVRVRRSDDSYIFVFPRTPR